MRFILGLHNIFNNTVKALVATTSTRNRNFSVGRTRFFSPGNLLFHEKSIALELACGSSLGSYQTLMKKSFDSLWSLSSNLEKATTSCKRSPILDILSGHLQRSDCLIIQVLCMDGIWPFVYRQVLFSSGIIIIFLGLWAVWSLCGCKCNT